MVFPRRGFNLRGRDIHVWAIIVHPNTSLLNNLSGILSHDETRRAGRYFFKDRRDSFIVTRGLLRMLLGRYLSIPPAEIVIEYGSAGKPHLGAKSPLQFNTAHSGNIVVYAFSYGCDIGVDIEMIRALPNMDSIVSRLFCKEEAREFSLFNEPRRQTAFFSSWARKEAYLKAVGKGLTSDLSSFGITVNPFDPARLTHIGGDENEALGWTITDLAISEGYASAIAYHDKSRPLYIERLLQPELIMFLGDIGEV